MNTLKSEQDKKNILELAYLENGKIRLSLSESHGQGPIAFYQENEIAIEKVDGSVREIIYYLNKINILKNPNQHFLIELQKSCQLLFNELLSQEIKVRLQNTPLKNLELIVDEQLVHIPWELLFDGQRFLCEQFSMGRQVRTRGNEIVHPSHAKQPKSQLSMLIIADPTEDLDVAWKEGISIYEEFQRREDMVKIILQSSDQVDLDFVKKNIWDYDLVHYAGHAEYDPGKPSLSGWMLSDGKLNASDIMKMAGGKKAMPRLVFGNACQSGYTEKWLKEKDNDKVDRIHNSYGLVHAFLISGVQYYIGTFCDVSDEYGAHMGIEFYHHLIDGNTIGESLRKARVSFQEKFGKESFSWINYVLYGHPGDYLVIPRGKNISRQDFNQEKTSGTDKANVSSKSLNPENEPAIPAVRRSSFSLPQKDRWIGTVIVLLLLLIFATLLINVPRLYLGNVSVQEEKDQLTSDDKTKRIEELKKMIYEKLKVREEKPVSSKTPALSEDRWTSKPLVMAIFDVFDEEQEPLPDWVNRIIKDIDKRLTRRFVEDAWVRVAERDELDKLLEEKDLELSDFSFNDQKDIFGKFLYAGVMVFLKGYRSPEGLSLCYKVVDADSGEIDKIDSGISLSKKENTEDLAEFIYMQAKEAIYAKRPLRGRIAMVKENLVILNIGSKVGVRKGDVFDVFDSGNEVVKGRCIGKIIAINDTVDPTKAVCEAIEGKEFVEGLRVEFTTR
ncbi:MAG: CHAT domain-containing protein [bacterium]